jgi:hypothetical protein
MTWDKPTSREDLHRSLLQKANAGTHQSLKTFPAFLLARTVPPWLSRLGWHSLALDQRAP